jgi:hypothetical protein
MPKKTDAKLTVPDVAARLGISPSTWRGYVARAKKDREAGRDRPGLAPAADGHYDRRTPWWWESTVDAYQSVRVGRGSRADLPRAASGKN